MPEEGRAGRRWRVARFVAVVVVALLVLLVAGLLALHAPPVRAYALRYAARLALAQGIVLEAERLDYNLITLRVAATALRVSAPGDAPPFFEADAVEVDLSRSVLRGEVAIEEVRVHGGLVRVVRDADGATNLPTLPASAETTEPEPLPVIPLLAPGLRIELRDETRGLRVEVPGVTIELAASGRVTLDAPAQVTRGETITSVTALDGGVGFDGRDVRLEGMRLATDEARLQVDGTLALRRREPGVDLRIAGDVDLGRAARWGLDQADALEGLAVFEGGVRGPLPLPAATVDLSSERMAWRGIVAAPVSARVDVDGDRLVLSDLRAGLLEGDVSGRGDLVWETLGVDVELAWRELSAPALTSLAADVVPRPSGRVSGELRAAGPLETLDAWQAEARLALAGGRDTETLVSAPGESRVTIDGDRWRLEARHRVAGVASVTASLGGRLNAQDPGASSLDGTVRAPGVEVADLVRRAAVAGLPSLPDERADGRIDLALRLGGALARPTVAFEVESEALTVEGQPLTGVSVTGTASTTVVEVERLHAAQPGEDGAVAGGLLSGSGRYDLRSGDYELRGVIEDWHVVPTGTTPLETTVRASVDAVRDDGGSRAEAWLVFDPTTAWQGMTVGEVEARLMTGDGREATFEVLARDLFTEVRGRMALEAPYRMSLKGVTEIDDLAPVRRFVDLDPSVQGSVRLEVTAEGEPQDWRAGEAVADVSRLQLSRDRIVAGLSGPARLRYADGRLIVEQLEARVGGATPASSGTTLRASGRLPVAGDVEPRGDDGLRVTLGGDLGEVLATLSLAGLDGLPGLEGEGPVTADVQVAGSVPAPRLTGNLDLGPASLQLAPDLPRVTGLRAQARVEDDVIHLRDLVATYDGARIVASGEVPVALATGSEPAPGAGVGRLQARIFDIAPAMLASVVEPEALEQVEGSVDVTVDLTASSRDLASVSGDLIFERFSLAVADLPVRQAVPTRVVVEDGVARVAAWDWQGEGASLTVSGQVDLVDRVAALETDGSLDLRLLTPFVRAAGITPAGRLESRLSLAGALDEPSITGDIRLADGAFRLAEPAVIVDDLQAAARFAGGEATLTELRGTINGGSLSGRGSLRYAPDTRGTFAFDVSGMALNAPEGLRSEIDAALELALAPEPGDGALAGELGGTVTVTRSSYREPLALITSLLGNLTAATGTATAEAGSPVLDRLALDVRVVTDEDLVIRNNVARAELGADLRVIGTAAAPSLSGRAELREGGQLFLGRNIYTVDTGTIDFANPVAIEPNLDIVASTRAGGEEIEIAISGTPDTLTRSLSSPSAPELGEADLTALLLTGRRMDQLGSAQAAEVSAQVLGNLSGDVLGVAGRAVGLDTLRVGGVDTSTTLRRDPADLASEVDPTTRLTFGKTLGSNLDVTWSQSLRNADAQTWIIDYALLRQIDLRLISDDEDLRTYAFRHDLTFGTPARARSGAAVADRAPSRVSAVRLAGSPGFPEPDLRRRLRLEAGDRFDFIAWQEDRDRLARFYRERGRLAARIGADRIETAGGVELIYELDAGPETTVLVRGADLGGEVVAGIEEAWAESIFDGFLVDEATQIVRSALAGDGYLRAAVQVAMTGTGGMRTLEVTIEPGERTRATEVRVEGVDEPLRSEVAGIARPLVDDGRGVTAPGAATADIVQALRARGYASAEVRLGTPEFDGPAVTLPVIVDAGAAFVVGAIEFEGVEGFEVDALREGVRLAEGDTHDPAAVEAAREAVQGRYRLEGFTMATVTARQQVRAEAQAIDLVFAVAEGPRQTVGEVAIAGRRSIDEDVVLRTMDLEVGEPLRAADWLEARQRLFESGLFRRADISLEPLSREAPPGEAPPGEQATGGEAAAATRPVRVRVLLEEWPALRLRYGFQVAEQRPEEDVNGRDLTPGLSADVTRRTLFGRAITVGLAGQWERREWLGRVFLNTPTLFRLPVQSSLSLERSRNVFAETRVRDGSTLSWEQRARRGPLRLSYGLRFERNHTYLQDAPVDPDFPVVDETVQVGLLTGSGAWDTRDDPADATRGTLLSSTIEHASGRLGSDLLFVRSLSQAYHFRKWKDVVFASAGRLGLVQPLGGQVLDPAERFFAGGSRTVRGVSEDGLGERDFFGPLGGRALVVVNQEARVPLFWWFRGVAFVDAGNVFDRIADVDLGNLTGSVGLGLRLATPFVLLRADYGRAVWGTTEEDTAGRWTFGIGHTF